MYDINSCTKTGVTDNDVEFGILLFSKKYLELNIHPSLCFPDFVIVMCLT